MIDISMAGSIVTIKGPKLSVEISEFASEGDPISIPDLEVRNGEMGLNGDLVTWAKPSPIAFSVSVIPGSESDRKLSAALRAGHIGGRGASTQFDSVYVQQLTIKTPYGQAKNNLTVSNSSSWVFSNGYLLSGSPAQGTNAEGKAAMKTYNFVFESVTQNTTIR